MLFTLLCLLPAQVNAQAVPAGIAVGADNLTRLLWNNPDGTASFWKLDSNGAVTSQNSYGPYPGWLAQGFAAGPDSAPRVLWNHPADSAMSLWNVASDNTFIQGTYIPVSGYQAKLLAAGPNSIARVVWRYSDGSISLWNDVQDAPGFSYHNYGPYANWTPAALAVDSGNAARLLWNNPVDQTVSLWKVAGDGSFTQQTYPSPSGYSPVALAAGTGGDVRLLWSNGQGQAQVWTIASGGAYTSKTYPIVSMPYRLVSVAANPNGITAGDSTTGTVTLSSAAPAGGVTVSLSSNTGVVVVPYSVTVPSGASTANFAITTNRSAPYTTAAVTATYAGASVSTSITVAPMPSGPPPPPTGASPDYKIFANPVNADVTESTSGSVNTAVTITVSPVNSYNSSVSLYLPTLPGGVTASLSSPVVSTASGDASSDLIFTVASTTRPGDYTINLKSISGYDNSVRYTPISLTVSPAVQPNANFTLSEDTDGLELEAGSTDKVMLTLNPKANFGSSTVGLSLQDDPTYPVLSNGITATFSTSPLTSGSPTSTLTVQVGSQVAEGNYHLLITGSNYTGTQTLVLTVFVLPNTSGGGATNDGNVPQPAPPSTPPFPVESSVSDMLRFDLNTTTGGQTSSFRPQVGSIQNNSTFYDFDADPAGLRPRFFGNPSSDDRYHIPPTYYPLTSVCKVVAYFRGSFNTGTGVLIGKNHVLTAAHVLYDGKSVAYRVDVFPGFDGGPSRVFHGSSTKWAWVPVSYDNEINHGGDSTYGDWAVLDVAPISRSSRPGRGVGLGTTASYMRAVDDFSSPARAEIAGYPDIVYIGATRKANQTVHSNLLFYSATGVGNDGPVLDTPPGGSTRSDNLVYYTIDVSSANSGGPIYHSGGSDPLFHVFAVVRGSGISGTNYNDGTRITASRQAIIGALFQEDKDEN